MKVHQFCQNRAARDVEKSFQYYYLVNLVNAQNVYLEIFQLGSSLSQNSNKHKGIGSVVRFQFSLKI